MLRTSTSASGCSGGGRPGADAWDTVERAVELSSVLVRALCHTSSATAITAQAAATLNHFQAKTGFSGAAVPRILACRSKDEGAEFSGRPDFLMRKPTCRRHESHLVR